MLDVALKYRHEGHWVESTRLAQQAIKVAEPLPGTGDQVANGYELVADNEFSLGHVLEALAMLDHAVSSVSERAGPKSVELSSTLARTALQAQGMNDFNRAETNLRRAIEIRQKADATSDPEFSNQLVSLGFLLEIRGRDKEALALFQRAVSVRESLNPNDRFLWQPLEQTGNVLVKMGRYQDAETAFLRMLKLTEGEMGLNSTFLDDPLNKLANLYHVAGRTDDEHRIQEHMQKLHANSTN